MIAIDESLQQDGPIHVNAVGTLSDTTPEEGLVMGTVYEINQRVIKNLKPLSKSKVKESVNKLGIFVANKGNDFYMLYCKEKSDITLFLVKDLEVYKEDMLECMENRGEIISIEMTEDKGAYEIWLRDNETDSCYYFFPYDSAVVVCS